VLAAVALLAGLGVGYAAGRGTSGAAAPSSRTSAASSPTAAPAQVNPLADVGPEVAQLAESCSVQTGTELQLGVEVQNLSETAVTLIGLRPVFPANGGLRLVTWEWAPCGANADGLSQSTIPLAPGSSAWLSVTLKVLVSCPAPDPVRFDVAWVAGHMSATTTTLPGFADPGQAGYSGCSPSGSAASRSSSFSAIFLGPSSLTVHTLLRRRLQRENAQPGDDRGPPVAVGIRLRRGLG
jgi:hypothetical protein